MAIRLFQAFTRRLTQPRKSEPIIRTITIKMRRFPARKFIVFPAIAARFRYFRLRPKPIDTPLTEPWPRPARLIFATSPATQRAILKSSPAKRNKRATGYPSRTTVLSLLFARPFLIKARKCPPVSNWNASARPEALPR